MTENRRLSTYIKNLLLTGIVGWIVSLYTLWHRAKVQAGVDLGQSFCNINAKINCDTIALSSYSEFGGVPVSSYGLIFFTIVSILAFRALRANQRGGGLGPVTRALICATGIAGLITSVGLAVLSLVKIGAFCLVCGIIYLLCFSLFFITWKIYRLSATHKKPERFSPVFMIVALLLIAAQLLFQPLANFAARGGVPAAEEGAALPPEFINPILNEFNSANSYEIPAQSSPAEGPADAKVTVVEFSDFECPHCAENHKHMPEVVNSFGGQARVIYKNYPLDPACNSGGMHTKACMAAWAARCVFKQKGLTAFRSMQDYLFTQQEVFDQKSVQDKAAELGVPPAELQTCMESSDTKQAIADEVDLAKSLGVDSTPSIYVNGRLLKMGANKEVLRAVIKDQLAK